MLHVDINVLHVDIHNLHVNIIMLHVNLIMLNVDTYVHIVIIYLACRWQKYASVVMSLQPIHYQNLRVIYTTRSLKKLRTKSILHLIYVTKSLLKLI